jgi:hypothetical protein
VSHLRKDALLARKTITLGGLYAILDAELAKIHPRTCPRCRMPLPYRVERPDDVSANWRIGTPAPCVHGCDVLIAEIATRLWPEYDLADSDRPIKVKPSGS